MVFDALLSKVNIPFGNIHPIPTQNCDLEGSASLYEQTIVDFFKLKKDEFPVFDLVLLGIGRDGHTSSLFPGNPALLVKDRLVVATSQIGIPEPRITLTLPVINNADMIFFLVSGFEKANIVHEVLEDRNNFNLPANAVRPSGTKLCWYLDKDAASRLEN
jgi:6-phosphogluconolactonase